MRRPRHALFPGSSRPPSPPAPARFFALKTQPPKQQPFLVTLKSPDDTASERVLLDPGVLDPKSRTVIDGYVPSRDGKRVAVCLSQGGTENGTRTIRAWTRTTPAR